MTITGVKVKIEDLFGHPWGSRFFAEEGSLKRVPR